MSEVMGCKNCRLPEKLEKVRKEMEKLEREVERLRGEYEES
ncbi:MAG: hypothetical protein QXJ27_02340 [Thermoplasmata archaeon]